MRSRLAGELQAGKRVTVAGVSWGLVEKLKYDTGEEVMETLSGGWQGTKLVMANQYKQYNNIRFTSAYYNYKQ